MDPVEVQIWTKGKIAYRVSIENSQQHENELIPAG